jgi:hypothetical protein
MRVLRGLLGLLLWILAGLLGLVSLLLCVTIILLPLGLWLFAVTRKLFATAVRLMMPRAMAHPVKESRRKGRKVTPDPPDLKGRAAKVRTGAGKKAGKLSKKARKKAKKKARKVTGRRRTLFG